MMTPWDQFFYQKMRLLSREKLVLDIGGGEPLQKLPLETAALFSKTAYFSIDYESVFKPTLVGDAHHLPIQTSSVPAVVCKAVLEHVKNPFEVANELFRITKKGGKILVYAPFLYQYHGDKYYQDYFRYTKDGLKELFKYWRFVELQPVRLYLETISNLLPSPFKFTLRLPAHYFDRFKPHTPQVSGYYLYAEK